jgi:hypothetical protein
MNIYEGRLRLKRTTKKMVIYGNDDLTNQYVPKTMFGKVGGEQYPSELMFTISVPNGDGK